MLPDAVDDGVRPASSVDPVGLTHDTLVVEVSLLVGALGSQAVIIRREPDATKAEAIEEEGAYGVATAAAIAVGSLADNDIDLSATVGAVDMVKGVHAHGAAERRRSSEAPNHLENSPATRSGRSRPRRAAPQRIDCPATEEENPIGAHRANTSLPPTDIG